MSDLTFEDIQGQTLHKQPGSINGQKFTLKSLDSCSVYLLDHLSEVEVTDCTNCQIFIGPVEGLAAFNGVKQCQVAVAAQHFSATACEDVEFGLYVSTQPQLTDCSQIRIGCWMGAYPGLSSHFATAGLNPNENMWDKVADASMQAGHAANYELIEAVHYWEVPVEDAGPPENPVPAADGALYASGGAADARDGVNVDHLGENGHGGPADEADFTDPHAPPQPTVSSMFAAPLEVNPKVAEMRARLAAQLGEQERAEQESKTAAMNAASNYLEDFYEQRNKRKAQRVKDNREAEAQLQVKGPEGDTEWERAVSLIDFGFMRPNGADLARYKNVLFTAKAKNVPIAARAK